MHTTMQAISPRRAAKDRRRIVIGPQDHGRRMTMAQFADARIVPGYHYELAHGVVEVTNIPNFLHNLIVDRIHAAFHVYDAAHPGIIHYTASSMGSKIEMWGSDTERHPDLSVYLTPPPNDNPQPWDIWIPDIVVEVVSASSAKRDYEDKPKEYLAAGVREYWIIDPQRKSALFLARRADMWIEKRVGLRGKWRTTLLPGFTLELARMLAKLPKRA